MDEWKELYDDKIIVDEGIETYSGDKKVEWVDRIIEGVKVD